MKRLMLFLLLILGVFFHNFEIKALPVAFEPLEIQKNGIKNTEILKNRDKNFVKGLSKKQHKKLEKKTARLKKKLKNRTNKAQFDDGIEDVFGERYFILGAIFFLGGLALAILGGIISFGLFGWLGGVGMVIGLVLIILAIIQVT